MKLKPEVKDPVVFHQDGQIQIGVVERINDKNKNFMYYYVRSESGRLYCINYIDDDTTGNYIDSKLSRAYFKDKEAPAIEILEHEDETTAIDLETRLDLLPSSDQEN